MVGLAPSHPLIREGKTVATNEFVGGGKQGRDLTTVEIRGKRKHVRRLVRAGPARPLRSI